MKHKFGGNMDDSDISFEIKCEKLISSMQRLLKKENSTQVKMMCLLRIISNFVEIQKQPDQALNQAITVLLAMKQQSDEIKHAIKK